MINLDIAMEKASQVADIIKKNTDGTPIWNC